MVAINKYSLITIIQAVQIAIEHYNYIISQNKTDDITDDEEFLIEMMKSADELKQAYIKIANEDPSWMSYEKLIQPDLPTGKIH